MSTAEFCLEGKDETRLKVAETFYSLQGESITAGCPAVFLRMSICDMACSFCDTIPVHSKGEWYSAERLVELFRIKPYLSALRTGARLVITGGNPMLQQQALVPFLTLLSRELQFLGPCGLPIEVETQASRMPISALWPIVTQWNVSPKLRNSGMKEEKRIREDVLSAHSRSPNSFFKFVVKTEEDMSEVLHDFVLPFQIPAHRVSLMPMCSTRDEHAVVGAEVAKFCLQYGMRFSPRLQLILWDRVVGC